MTKRRLVSLQRTRVGATSNRINGPYRRSESLALGLLLVAALVIRVAWLRHVPTNITADEADNLKTVLRIEATGQPGFFGLDWKPAPAFSMYVAREFMRILGDDVFGLRMSSAVLSTLALIPFYALARRVVSPPAAFAGAALLASGRWYLHFSRSGWENVDTALYALLAAWALTVALERGQLRWFILAGGAAALGLYGYFAGRLILPALLAYAPFAWWWARRGGHRLTLSGRAGRVRVTARPLGHRRRPERVVMIGFAVLALTAVVLFLPQLNTIHKNWTFFNQRVRVVSIFNVTRPYLGQSATLGILRLQTERTLSAYVLMDGQLFNNGRYRPGGQPLYDPATGLLFLGGLALSIWRWRGTALWWCMLAVPLIGTQVFTSGTPDAARAVIVAPFIYLFVTLPLDAILNLLTGRWRGAAAGALLVGALLLAMVNIRAYADWIRTPAAAAARQPALAYADFPRWRDGFVCGLRGGAYGDGPLAGPRCVHLPPGPDRKS